MKVGDKVYLLDGANIPSHLGWYHARYAGQTGTIIGIDEIEPMDFNVQFGDSALWCDPKWLQPLNVPATPDLKIKTAAGKVPLNLIPLISLAGTARVFQHGATKYEPGNFLLARDDDAPNRYLGALQRHVMEFQNPNGLFSWEDLGARDVESGLPAIDHAIASLLMLRAVAVRHGALPLDPGVSKLIEEPK